MNCEHCGAVLPEGKVVCSVCGTAVTAEQIEAVCNPVKENVGLGILGALIGALIGGASIVGLNLIGYVASISGVLMGFATLKGYELLGKKLSKKGIVISVLLMIVVTFAANMVCIGIEVYNEFKAYGATLADSFTILPELFMNDGIDFGAFFTNLGMLYAFVALGAFFIIRDAFKKV